MRFPSAEGLPLELSRSAPALMPAPPTANLKPQDRTPLAPVVNLTLLHPALAKRIAQRLNKHGLWLREQLRKILIQRIYVWQFARRIE